MNITYMIGNGYDIQLGMETRYVDFYHWLTEKGQVSQDNQIYQVIKKDEPSDYSNWADFELSLGQYTIDNQNDFLSSSSQDKFMDDLDEIKDKLADYLESEEEYLEFFHNQTISSLIDNPLLHLSADQRKYILASVNEKDYIVFNFLTFNYTKTVDILVDHIEKYIFNGELGKFYHVHGEINNHLTLGLDNKTQLANTFDEDNLKYLLKPNTLKLTGDYMPDYPRVVLEESDVIIIFGMSLGETDKTWWKQILEIMSRNKKVVVIIYDYIPNISRHTRRMIKRNDEVIDSFLKYADGYSDSLRNNLRHRIFVVFNKELFNYMK